MADPTRLQSLGEAARGAGTGRGPAPVEKWNPPFCGDIDMRIARDGTWFYGGTPIGRPALVQLFSTILRKDPERYVLVTPVERVGIVVEDAPFLAVEMRVEGEGAPAHLPAHECGGVGGGRPRTSAALRPHSRRGLKPYVHVRGALEALVKRALVFDLAELAQTRVVDGVETIGVWSGGAFFAIGSAAA
ncbi:MAG: DUF1285 domain-containing protein [Rhodoblastus sp.]|nr:MAG: DUF1285 domain-containing protein [Rhodoblastus sp.]